MTAVSRTLPPGDCPRSHTLTLAGLLRAQSHALRYPFPAAEFSTRQLFWKTLFPAFISRPCSFSARNI